MEIEKEIIKLSSCQKFLLIQSFRTLINVIDLENFRQKQINFRQAPFSFIDYAQDELIVGGTDGKLYLKDESIQIHTGAFISGIVKDGMLLSLGEDGLLKQTNIKTFQCLYSRKLTDHVKDGQIFLIGSSVLVNYDLKVILINLENDVIETKFKVNQQGPLQLRINNLSKDFFSILGKEGQLTVYNIGMNEPILSIQAPLNQNYELYYMAKKTTVLFWNNDTVTCYVKETELIKQYEVQIKNLQSVIQGQDLLLVYDNISNPKLKLVRNIEGQKFKSLYQQEQLQKFNEQQHLSLIENNKDKKQTSHVPIAFYEQEYIKMDASNNNKHIEPKECGNEQNMINVLKQSLIAKDKVVLEYALERTLKNGIVDSVNALQLEYLQELLNYLVDKLISYPELTKQYIFWVKAIVQRGVGDFSKIGYLLEERTKHINKLETICSKIQFNKLTVQPKKEKDYRKQPHTVYEEQESKIVILEGEYNRKQPPTDGTQIEEQTDQVDDDFNQAYLKHKQELRQQAYQEIDEEAYDNEDLKF